jgi:hypothetical protein
MDIIKQQFEGVTPAQFDALVEKVKAETGVVITTDSGTAQDEKKKWSVDFDFNRESGELSIAVTKAPWPEELAPGKIAAAIKQMVFQALQA